MNTSIIHAYGTGLISGDCYRLIATGRQRISITINGFPLLRVSIINPKIGLPILLRFTDQGSQMETLSRLELDYSILIRLRIQLHHGFSISVEDIHSI